MGKRIEIKPNDQSWVGEKVKISAWSNKSTFIEIMFVGSYSMFAKDNCGAEETHLLINEGVHWELYEEAERKEENEEGHSEAFCKICGDRIIGETTSKYETYSKIRGICPNGHASTRIVEYKKTKRMAPAAMRFSRGYWEITDALYSSESEAKESIEQLGKNITSWKWPAGEGYWVEIPDETP